MSERGERSITARSGDRGTTRLHSGEVVPKHDPRVEALGEVDELVSVLGMARAAGLSAEGKEQVCELQRLLFRLGAVLADAPGPAAEAGIGPEEVGAMDRLRETLEASPAMPGDFVVPGATPGGAALDLSRAVARRVERRLVACADDGIFDSPDLLVWMNRLSDVLWLLARREERVSTPLWQGL